MLLGFRVRHRCEVLFRTVSVFVNTCNSQTTERHRSWKMLVSDMARYREYLVKTACRRDDVDLLVLALNLIIGIMIGFTEPFTIMIEFTELFTTWHVFTLTRLPECIHMGLITSACTSAGQLLV